MEATRRVEQRLLWTDSEIIPIVTIVTIKFGDAKEALLNSLVTNVSPLLIRQVAGWPTFRFQIE